MWYFFIFIQNLLFKSIIKSHKEVKNLPFLKFLSTPLELVVPMTKTSLLRDAGKQNVEVRIRSCEDCHGWAEVTKYDGRHSLKVSLLQMLYSVKRNIMRSYVCISSAILRRFFIGNVLYRIQWISPNKYKIVSSHIQMMHMSDPTCYLFIAFIHVLIYVS